MAWFRARNISTSTVPVPADVIWPIITDPQQLAGLTPLIESIEPRNDLWTWRLHGIEALGLTVAAVFTESMTFIDERQIRFEHTPPAGSTERTGVRGVYDVDPISETATGLRVDLTLSVELPLPRAARPAVERILQTSMRLTGRRFAENLYELLDLDPRDVSVVEVSER